jgi:AcrR family transcriptional regulator
MCIKYASVLLRAVIRKVQKSSRVPAKVGGKRERTRARLIEAASHVIGEKGFHETTLDEVAARAGMTRGAIYGNFKNREDLFLEVVKQRWEPIIPNFKPGGTFREQMRAIGRAVVAAAPVRQKSAVGALSFQLFALTHPEMRKRISRQNAEIYRLMAAGLIQFISAEELPMPAERFVRVLHALTDGLLVTRFLTPDLITDEVILSAFEMLAPESEASRVKRQRSPKSMRI